MYVKCYYKYDKLFKRIIIFPVLILRRIINIIFFRASLIAVILFETIFMVDYTHSFLKQFNATLNGIKQFCLLLGGLLNFATRRIHSIATSYWGVIKWAFKIISYLRSTKQYISLQYEKWLPNCCRRRNYLYRLELRNILA